MMSGTAALLGKTKLAIAHREYMIMNHCTRCYNTDLKSTVRVEDLEAHEHRIVQIMSACTYTYQHVFIKTAVHEYVRMQQ